MSVNGDLMVIRNGRSTSQVSVYNYPEHLNPFYEDDNHKRLRFWKINKTAKDGQGRRNSFSLGGIKDMWAFKSFRMKKKSSSLGINKTSESPPPLRRDIYANENGYSTYDPRMRYTTGATKSLGVDDAFQRNASYRSSLQDMRYNTDPSTNGIGFNRNDRYRSTIQTATTSAASSPAQSLTLPTHRRYVYRGSVTPQPVRNNDFHSDSLGMISRGSSQASVASTNPFDDDDDDVVMGPETPSTAKHSARKKRRAPPPPVPVHQIIKEESSSGGSTPSHNANNTQSRTNTNQEDERLEIQNLTAEIESFVKSSNTDSPEHEVRSSPSKVTTTTTTTTIITSKDASNSPKQNGTIPKAAKTNGQANTDVDITVAADAEPLFIREEQDAVEKKESPVRIVETPGQPKVKEVGHVEAIHVHVETTRSSPEKVEPSRVSTFRVEAKPKSPEKTVKRSSPEKVVTSTTVEVVEVHKPAENPAEELKIKESPEKPRIAAKPNNIPKSPKLTGPRPAETPATPAMRRREIKIQPDPPSTPEMRHREVGIDVVPTGSPVAKRQEVTITVERVVSTAAQEPAPIPAVREHRPSSMGKTSPLPAARKISATENELNSSVKEEAKEVPKQIQVEEKISNLDANVPAPNAELQLKISETEERNSQRVEEAAAQPIPSTSNAEAARPVPIEKPPRTKHFTEDIPDPSIYRPRPMEWKQSTLAPLTPVPPEKRRSVKQIIESINRNQRLLNGQKEDEDASNGQSNSSEANTNAMEQNFRSLAEAQREMKRMLEELDGLENVNERKLSNKSDENFQGILDTIVSTLAKESAKKNDNTEIFKKCTITKEVNNASRESSPTSSNLDWNPVPKPKRTKNLSPELQVKKNNDNNN